MPTLQPEREPRQRPCPDCNTQYHHKDGTTYGDGLCADCGGTGKDPLTDEPCEACFGSGLCDTCNRSGTLSAEVER